jgi:hypothetical protein
LKDQIIYLFLIFIFEILVASFRTFGFGFKKFINIFISKLSRERPFLYYFYGGMNYYINLFIYFLAEEGRYLFKKIWRPTHVKTLVLGGLAGHGPPSHCLRHWAGRSSLSVWADKPRTAEEHNKRREM